MRRETWRGGACALLAVIAALLFASAAHAADDELRGTSSGDHGGDHVWLVLDPRGESAVYELVHLALSDEAWAYRAQHSMTQPPVAMAAAGDEIWLVNPPRTFAGGFQREVFSARVQQNAATGLYYLTPVGRLEMQPTLEGLGRLAGFVAASDGPTALIVPAPRTGASLSMANASQPARVLEKPLLLNLPRGATEWSERLLPDGFIGTRDAQLGLAGDALVLMDAVPDNPARTNVYFERGDAGEAGEAGEAWKHAAFVLDVRDVRSLINVAGQCVAVLDHHQGGPVELAYVRPSGLLPLTTFPAPDGLWLACGLDDQVLVVIHARGEGDPVFNVTRIDALTGALRDGITMTRQPITAGRLWPIALALGLSLSAVLAAMLLRPPPSESIAVKPERVLAPGRRVLAAAIDLAVGALPAMLLLNCAPADLLTMPMVSSDFSRSGPYVVMVAISGVVATTLEVFFACSLGKMLVGARLTDLQGQRPRWWRIVIRGAIRMLVFVIPPLGAFTLTNAHMQGLPDMAARSLVLANDPPAMAESTHEN